MKERPIGAALLDLGWAAGRVLRTDHIDRIRVHLARGKEPSPKNIDGSVWPIVISQTCDLVACKEEAEPYADLLLARPLDARKPRSQYCDLRSTRQLDFRPDRNNWPDLILTAHASIDRFVIPRRVLLNSPPDADRLLSDVAIRRLHGWLALRVSRPSWPNSFVGRLNPNRTELEKALNPLREDISEVRIGLNPSDRELQDDESYQVVVFFVIDAEHYLESPDVRREAADVFANFVSLLQKCPGIDLDQDISDVISGDEFTWQMTQSTDIWDFAHLSPLE